MEIKQVMKEYLKEFKESGIDRELNKFRKDNFFDVREVTFRKISPDFKKHIDLFYSEQQVGEDYYSNFMKFLEKKPNAYIFSEPPFIIMVYEVPEHEYHSILLFPFGEEVIEKTDSEYLEEVIGFSKLYVDGIRGIKQMLAQKPYPTY